MHVRAVDIIKTFTASSSRPALDGVTLDVKSGELMGLLGPSGSGKTTLLRIIAGLDIPDSGSIFFGGEDASQKSVQERRVGFVFQNYALFKHLTIADNIAFGLEVRSRELRPPKAEIRRRALELLDLVQLSGLEKRRPAQLSGGQRQRVALARALAVEPRVLLLDEPFGALDAKVRRDLRGWLREIHQRTGHTTTFVTHDQDEALELSDRVAVLNAGRIEQVGTPDEIYDHPETPFVNGFIGEATPISARLEAGHVFIGPHQLRIEGMAGKSGKGRLFVRPQDIVIGGDESDALQAHIVAVRRNGATRRAEIEIPAHAGRVEIETHSSVSVRAGDSVPIQFVRGTFFLDGEGATA
jgi:sulfate transport system ATP-binding protein